MTQNIVNWKDFAIGSIAIIGVFGTLYTAGYIEYHHLQLIGGVSHPVAHVIRGIVVFATTVFIAAFLFGCIVVVEFIGAFIGWVVYDGDSWVAKR